MRIAGWSATSKIDKNHITTQIHRDSKSGIKVIKSNLSTRIRNEGRCLRATVNWVKWVEGHELNKTSFTYTKSTGLYKVKEVMVSVKEQALHSEQRWWTDAGRDRPERWELSMNGFSEHRFPSHQWPDLLRLIWSPLSWRQNKCDTFLIFLPCFWAMKMNVAPGSTRSHIGKKSIRFPSVLHRSSKL